MILFDCSPMRLDIAALVDGELRGAKVLRVLEHLEHCAECTEYAEELRSLGDALRAEAPEPVPSAPAGLEGLASTVISRTKAEAAQSWWGVFSRAREDWHWVIVGAGSVAATLVSTTLLSAILAFGPNPGREDSLSALIENFRSPAGLLFVRVTPVGGDQEPRLMQVDDGGPVASSAAVALASRSEEYSLSNTEVVTMLEEAMTSKGRTLSLEAMAPDQREYTESLLREIRRQGLSGPLPVGVPLNVHEVRLVAFASVSAKGL
jgi:Putative zinc-finger